MLTNKSILLEKLSSMIKPPLYMLLPSKDKRLCIVDDVLRSLVDVADNVSGEVLEATVEVSERCLLSGHCKYSRRNTKEGQ